MLSGWDMTVARAEAHNVTGVKEAVSIINGVLPDGMTCVRKRHTWPSGTKSTETFILDAQNNTRLMLGDKYPWYSRPVGAETHGAKCLEDALRYLGELGLTE